MLFARPLPLPAGMWPMGSFRAHCASDLPARPLKTSCTKPSPLTMTMPWQDSMSMEDTCLVASFAPVVVTTSHWISGTSSQSSFVRSQALRAPPVPLAGLRKTRSRLVPEGRPQRAETWAAQASARRTTSSGAPSRPTCSSTSARTRAPPGLRGQCTSRTVPEPPSTEAPSRSPKPRARGSSGSRRGSGCRPPRHWQRNLPAAAAETGVSSTPCDAMRACICTLLRPS
mmetsp:Transcript_49161/g.157188  ORF Transcript_49161/g.157188 Transcript_49161/m.157188 type:complete len:228 (+) Transcript_49161:797-1480(+)